MNFESYVRTWSRNNFRQVVSGKKVDKSQIPNIINRYQKKNPFPVDQETVGDLIVSVAEERGYIR